MVERVVAHRLSLASTAVAITGTLIVHPVVTNLLVDIIILNNVLIASPMCQRRLHVPIIAAQVIPVKIYVSRVLGLDGFNLGPACTSCTAIISIN